MSRLMSYCSFLVILALLLSPGLVWLDQVSVFGDSGAETIGADVEIKVILQGGSRPDSGWVVPFSANFYSPGTVANHTVLTAEPLYSFDLTTALSGSGALALATAIPPGSYDISVVSPHCLTNVKSGVVIQSPSTSVDMGTLIEGDSNNDNKISIQDFGLMSAAYGSGSEDPAYNVNADFDRNNKVNIADFGLLVANYGEIAPVDITPPCVTTVSPVENETAAAVDAPIEIVFSKAMQASVLSANFTLTRDGEPVDGTLSYFARVATFIPEYSLKYGTVYTATVLTGAADTAGNTLEEAFTWNFTTLASTQSVNLSVNTPDEVTAGGTFDVQINISEVENLTAYQFDLNFDSTVIQLIDSEFVSSGLVGDAVTVNTAADKNGKIRVLGTVEEIGRTANGKGYLAVIHFKVIGSAGQTSELDFTQIKAGPRYTDYLFDADSMPIFCITTCGSVKIAE